MVRKVMAQELIAMTGWQEQAYYIFEDFSDAPLIPDCVVLNFTICWAINVLSWRDRSIHWPYG